MKEFYISRLKEGWTLSETDNTDFWWWINLMAHLSQEDVVTIDEIMP